mmetsp:Transcript_5257/g.16238  ORF Transcript_5257/g.16238 Transcript_5257/m.16238 type:complete len:227 (+) Transcript_5257:114-794(+)
MLHGGRCGCRAGGRVRQEARGGCRRSRRGRCRGGGPGRRGAGDVSAPVTLRHVRAGAARVGAAALAAGRHVRADRGQAPAHVHDRRALRPTSDFQADPLGGLRRQRHDLVGRRHVAAPAEVDPHARGEVAVVPRSEARQLVQAASPHDALAGIPVHQLQVGAASRRQLDVDIEEAVRDLHHVGHAVHHGHGESGPAGPAAHVVGPLVLVRGANCSRVQGRRSAGGA